jgi:predicted DNA binding CopG/RHH family protein
MRKKFTTTIDEEVLKEIKIQAIKEGLNVSELIEKMFEYYIKTFDDSSHD